jgi:hypothetical protein
MKNLLAFLQVIEIIGRWIRTAIYNFHITSSILLIIFVFGRLINGLGGILETTLIIYLASWVYRQHNRNRKLDRGYQATSIDNKQTIQVLNQVKNKRSKR